MMNQEREVNNGFGTIPSPRGRWAGGVHCALLVGWLGWVMYKVKTAHTAILGVNIQPLSGQKSESDSLQSLVFVDYLFITAALLLTSVFSGLLHSIGLFVEELKHVKSRHGGRYLQALRSCLHFPMSRAQPILLVSFMAVLFILWFIETDLFLQLSSQYWDLLVLLAGVGLIIHILHFMTPAEVQVMEKVEGSRQNVAHGLAWSYYTGYLKIVLPSLCDRIEKSKWKNQIHPTAHRLLVLMPLKCDVRVKLGDADPNIMNVTEYAADDKSLPPIKVDRGGIMGRVYKNDVHRVIDPDAVRSEYCIVEYATNVQTLHDMQAFCEGFSREAREQQVKLLYCTLKSIIDEDPECRDKVVLVPLDITDDEDHKLSKVLLRTLDQLRCGTVDMPDVGQERTPVEAVDVQDREQEDPAAAETLPKGVQAAAAAEGCDCTAMQGEGESCTAVPCQESQEQESKKPSYIAIHGNDK